MTSINYLAGHIQITHLEYIVLPLGLRELTLPAPRSSMHAHNTRAHIMVFAYFDNIEPFDSMKKIPLFIR